jgi:hypothetical protein
VEFVLGLRSKVEAGEGMKSYRGDDRVAEFAVSLAALAIAKTENGWSHTFWLSVSIVWLAIWFVDEVLHRVNR